MWLSCVPSATEMQNEYCPALSLGISKANSPTKVEPRWEAPGRAPRARISAMYGRRPRCKGKIGHFSEAFGCSHVFGLLMQPLWPLALM